MSSKYLFLPLLLASLLFACRGPETKTDAAPAEMIFHFVLNEQGEIEDEGVKQQLANLAKDMSQKGDRLMLTAYSEQTGDVEKNNQIAFDMADAAKKWMTKNHERAYYNIGVTIKGYEQPLNAAEPASLQNRRIEFSYLN